MPNENGLLPAARMPKAFEPLPRAVSSSRERMRPACPNPCWFRCSEAALSAASPSPCAYVVDAADSDGLVDSEFRGKLHIDGVGGDVRMRKYAVPFVRACPEVCVLKIGRGGGIVHIVWPEKAFSPICQPEYQFHAKPASNSNSHGKRRRARQAESGRPSAL